MACKIGPRGCEDLARKLSISRCQRAPTARANIARLDPKRLANVRVLRGLKIEDKLILRRRLNRPSPLNQANFFNCTVSAEQPVPAAALLR
jgi:hypothetical protein